MTFWVPGALPVVTFRALGRQMAPENLTHQRPQFEQGGSDRYVGDSERRERQQLWIKQTNEAIEYSRQSCRFGLNVLVMLGKGCHKCGLPIV